MKETSHSAWRKYWKHRLMIKELPTHCLSTRMYHYERKVKHKIKRLSSFSSYEQNAIHHRRQHEMKMSLLSQPFQSWKTPPMTIVSPYQSVNTPLWKPNKEVDEEKHLSITSGFMVSKLTPISTGDCDKFLSTTNANETCLNYLPTNCILPCAYWSCLNCWKMLPVDVELVTR